MPLPHALRWRLPALLANGLFSGRPRATRRPAHQMRRTGALLLTVAWLGGCAGPGQMAGLAGATGTMAAPATPALTLNPGTAPDHTVFAVTDQAELIRFKASRPQHLLQRQALQGLPAGRKLVGIDFRVARGVLYALSDDGQLFTLETASGRLARVGTAEPVALQGQRFGFDFNPAADRIRVVSDSGQNLRLHPDTGVLAATDPPLQGAAGPGAARVTAAAYTYNKADERLTTNYAIDAGTGMLLLQGSQESVRPVVSPNTGVLSTVGPLGAGALQDVSFDIADTDNAALAALRTGNRTRLWRLDLASGRATPIGPIGEGRALWGMAIEP